MDMNESRTVTLDAKGRVIDDSPFLVFRLSWVAYLRDLFVFVGRVFLCVIATSVLAFGLERFANMPSATSWLPVVGLVVAIAWTAYSVAFTYSVRLFSDETGVWMQSGVFPWEKGVSGVQWRDVGQAGYTRGFLAWLLRSYDVRISHGFTDGDELYLKNVHCGNLAVMHVNGVMSELQGRIVR